MKITVELPDEVEQALEEVAQAQGTEASDYAATVLASYFFSANPFLEQAKLSPKDNEFLRRLASQRNIIVYGVGDKNVLRQSDSAEIRRLMEEVTQVSAHVQEMLPSVHKTFVDWNKIRVEVEQLHAISATIKLISDMQWNMPELLEYNPLSSDIDHPVDGDAQEVGAEAQPEELASGETPVQGRQEAAIMGRGMFAGRGRTVNDFLEERHAEGEAEYERWAKDRGPQAKGAS